MRNQYSFKVLSGIHPIKKGNRNWLVSCANQEEKVMKKTMPFFSINGCGAHVPVFLLSFDKEGDWGNDSFNKSESTVLMGFSSTLIIFPVVPFRSTGPCYVSGVYSPKRCNPCNKH